MGGDLCKIPIFGTFLRNALLERLKIFQYSLRVLRCYCFELCSKLRFCKGLCVGKCLFHENPALCIAVRGAGFYLRVSGCLRHLLSALFVCRLCGGIGRGVADFVQGVSVGVGEGLVLTGNSQGGGLLV